MGIGLGFTGFSAPCIMSLWFEKKRVQFLMIAMSGGGVGSFAYANIIVQMLGAFHDKGAAECRIGVNDPSACNEWRPTLRYIGLLSALVLFIASLFMRAPKIKEVENYENKTCTKPEKLVEEDEKLPMSDLSEALNKIEKGPSSTKELLKDESLRTSQSFNTSSPIKRQSLLLS